MKKLIYLFLSAAIATTTLSACSSSSSDNDNGGGGGDNGGGITGSIVGDWQPQKFTMYSNGTPILQSPYEHECPSNKDHSIFRADGTMTSYEYDENCELYSVNLSYTISDNIITSIEEGTEFEETVKILTLNNTTLIIEQFQYDYEEEEDGTPGNMSVRVEYKRI
ncbi:MAG TPA: hypothetical protein VLZ11_03450 [Flavobacterium sp.]|nr:hypothetical protein [Flavobacterium sp.]